MVSEEDVKGCARPSEGWVGLGALCSFLPHNQFYRKSNSHLNEKIKREIQTLKPHEASLLGQKELIASNRVLLASSAQLRKRQEVTVVLLAPSSSSVAYLTPLAV